MPNKTYGKGNGGRGWTLQEIETIIQDKVKSHTRKPCDQFQEAFRLFGRPQHGFTADVFRMTVKGWGVDLSRKDSKELFDRYDADGSGDVDFYEFVRHLFGRSDFTAPLWNVLRDREMEVEEKARRAQVRAMGTGNADAIASDTARAAVDAIAFPAALAGVRARWTAADLEAKVRTLLLARTAGNASQQKAMYKLFGVHAANGVSAGLLRDRLREFGLDLRAAEVGALYERWLGPDHGRQGAARAISFHDFCGKVLPADYTEAPWNVKVDEAVYAKEAAEVVARRDHKAVRAEVRKHHFPPSLAKFRPTERRIEEMVRDKIRQRVKAANEENKHSFQMFDRPSRGIGPEVFKEKLHQLGLELSEREMDRLYRRYDSDGSGEISWQEFIHSFVQPAFTEKPWNLVRDEEQVRERAAGKAKRLATAGMLKEMPVSLRGQHRTVAQLHEAVMDKIRMKTDGTLTQTRDAYKLFGSAAHGVTLPVFMTKLRQMGVVCADEEGAALFQSFDTSGEGILSFHEFAQECIPPDRTTKSWTVVANERAEAEEAVQARKDGREQRKLAKLNRQIRNARGESWPGDAAAEEAEKRARAGDKEARREQRRARRQQQQQQQQLQQAEEEGQEGGQRRPSTRQSSLAPPIASARRPRTTMSSARRPAPVAAAAAALAAASPGPRSSARHPVLELSSRSSARGGKFNIPSKGQYKSSGDPMFNDPAALLVSMRAELTRCAARRPDQVPPAASTHLNQRAPEGSDSFVLGRRPHKSRPRTGTSEYERAMLYAQPKTKDVLSGKIGAVPSRQPQAPQREPRQATPWLREGRK